MEIQIAKAKVKDQKDELALFKAIAARMTSANNALQTVGGVEDLYLYMRRSISL